MTDRSNCIGCGIQISLWQTLLKKNLSHLHQSVTVGRDPEMGKHGFF